jgi:hypothetical protein
MKKLLLIIGLLMTQNLFSQGVTVDSAELIKLITREYDEIEKETIIRSPMTELVSLTKYIKGKSIKYYLSLQTNGSTLSTSKSGCTILFEDGTKIKKETKVDVNVSGDGDYRYSVFFLVTPQELELYRKKAIKQFRLYIYDGYLNKYNVQDFQFYVTQILKMK